MSLLKEIGVLLRKEIKLELRQKFAINSLLLYIVGTIIVAFMSFYLKMSALNVEAWNSIFWIILLFIAITSVSKSFFQEKESRNFYYYYVVSPQAIILSKIIYNFFLLSLLSLLTAIIYMGVLRPLEEGIDFIGNKSMFFLTVWLGATGFAGILTLVSAIASKASKNGTLMPVLSFPILIPLLIILVKTSMLSIEGAGAEIIFEKILSIILINVVVSAVSFLLFPYLWRS